MATRPRTRILRSHTVFDICRAKTLCTSLQKCTSDNQDSRNAKELFLEKWAGLAARIQRSCFWRGGLGWQLGYVCVAVGGRGEHTQPKWETLAKPASRVCGEIERDGECSPTSPLYVES